jgi:hypothetical protein
MHANYVAGERPPPVIHLPCEFICTKDIGADRGNLKMQTLNSICYLHVVNSFAPESVVLSV